MYISRHRLVQLALLALAAWAATYTRVVLGPLQETLRVSLALSDNQIALLQGLAVALPMALAAIPLGLLADRASRVRMLIGSMALSFLSLVLTAFARDFNLLLVARALAGLSLPGILVATYSMMGDLFPPDERGRATVAVAVAESLGGPAAFALGGTLLVIVVSVPGMTIPVWELADWRWALLWMGGALLPVLFLLFLLQEPHRKEQAIQVSSLREVWPDLWHYRHVAVPLQLARATVFIADGRCLSGARRFWLVNIILHRIGSAPSWAWCC